jgi:hypothetical protein
MSCGVQSSAESLTWERPKDNQAKRDGVTRHQSHLPLIRVQVQVAPHDIFRCDLGVMTGHSVGPRLAWLSFGRSQVRLSALDCTIVPKHSPAAAGFIGGLSNLSGLCEQYDLGPFCGNNRILNGVVQGVARPEENEHVDSSDLMKLTSQDDGQ